MPEPGNLLGALNIKIFLMETKSSNQQRRFRQLCNFCGGDHWNDNCPAYATVDERKQVLKRLGSCFICLKRGHRAFECFTQKTCFFCKRENYHHRSLCHQNINNYSVPLNKSELHEIKKELKSRQDSIENIKLQSTCIQSTPNNEQISEEAETLCYKTHSNASEYKQILNELRQTKSDLEDSKKENVSLNDRISKLEAEQKILQTSVSRNTETMQQVTTEIVQLKEKHENLTHYNSAFSMEPQCTFVETNAIAGDKTNKPRSDGKQRLGAEQLFENGNSNHTLNMTNKLHTSWMRLKHTNEELEECSFLEMEKSQRKRGTLSTSQQSAVGGTGKNTVNNQMEILISMLKGLTLLQDGKTTPIDMPTNNEELVYGWVKVLGFLTQNKFLN